MNGEGEGVDGAFDGECVVLDVVFDGTVSV